MELKQFVSKALRDLTEAVAESSEALSRIGVELGPPAGVTRADEDAGAARQVKAVMFDLAVTADPAGDGSGRITVLSGATGSDGAAAPVSRIRFSVPLAFRLRPAGREPAERPRDIDWE